MATIADYHEPGPRRPASPRAPNPFLVIPLACFFALAFLALGYVIYVLWPRWPEPPVAVDAPALPINVAGVVFNVAPAAIRQRVQRHPGVQQRIDLVYLWPSLTPPEAATSVVPNLAPPTGERVFVTIAGSDGRLAPPDRLKAIYPRYTDGKPEAGPDGLILVRFRNDTPYQGEDLLYDPTTPEQFIARCTRNERGPMPGMCLFERRIGSADVVVRFPREWLDDWRNVLAGVDRLIVLWRPAAG